MSGGRSFTGKKLEDDGMQSLGDGMQPLDDGGMQPLDDGGMQSLDDGAAGCVGVFDFVGLPLLGAFKTGLLIPMRLR